jgi:TRAP-type C4-dicarboxylate transport system permease small subunit
MAIAGQAEARMGAVLYSIAKAVAYIGGAILVMIATTTVLSIIGRALIPFGLSPIKGDFELVEHGCAMAIFLFLPFCQLRRGHVTVDIISERLPARLHAFLGFLGDCLIALASGVILWRIWLAFGEKFPYGSDGFRAALGMGGKPFFPETTYELEVPVWIPYSVAVFGAVLFLVISLYTVWRSLNWVLDGGEVRV